MRDAAGQAATPGRRSSPTSPPSARPQAKLRRLTSLYAALSECNQAIVRVDDRNLNCCSEVCRDRGGLRRAAHGLDRTRPAGRPRGARGAASARALDYIEGVDISLDPRLGRQAAGRRRDAAARGPTRGLRRHRRRPRHGCPGASGRSAAASVLRPLSPCAAAAEPVGALNLYAPVARFFDAELVELLDEMAAGHPLRPRPLRASRRQRETAERRFRTLVEQAADAIFVTDVDGRIVDVNAARLRLPRLYPRSTDRDEHDRPRPGSRAAWALRRCDACTLRPWTQGQIFLGQHRRRDGCFVSGGGAHRWSAAARRRLCHWTGARHHRAAAGGARHCATANGCSATSPGQSPISPTPAAAAPDGEFRDRLGGGCGRTHHRIHAGGDQGAALLGLSRGGGGPGDLPEPGQRPDPRHQRRLRAALAAQGRRHGLGRLLGRMCVGRRSGRSAPRLYRRLGRHHRAQAH
ncbi:MAG: PAS domain S-box protein [Desulfobacterales bacterium]|nr:PAS domain S-box protein [Desulfobacterales bacterium]